MHEGAITQAIIDSALESLAAHQVSGRAVQVKVTVGVAQGLVPDAMRMFFDLQKTDTPLAAAELVVTMQPLIGRCAECAKDFELTEPFMYCPDCGTAMSLIKGKEVLLTAIEVEQ